MLEELHAWHEFYLLVGSSAAALTGLMFVVVSIGPDIIADRPHAGVRAFVTPTIVFFTTALIVPALMLAPHLTPISLGVLLGLVGFGGLVYLFWVRGHEHWRAQQLDGEDWVFYIGLPFVAYVLLFAAAVAIAFTAPLGVAVLALTMVLLLIVGIHNAWDIVIWLAQRRRK
jgi:hypothetical protein